MGFENSLQSDDQAETANDPIEVEGRNESGKRKLYTSLAFAAMMFATQAEARISDIETPETERLKTELQEHGVSSVRFLKGSNRSIETDVGIINLPNSDLPAKEHFNKALEGVTAEQFLNEIAREKSSKDSIGETVNTANGPFEITISPYALEVMEQINISYEDGKLKNNKGFVSLTGDGTKNPNTECFISGTVEPFKNYIEAQCKEMQITNGSPYIKSITYTINGNLEVIEIPR